MRVSSAVLLTAALAVAGCGRDGSGQPQDVTPPVSQSPSTDATGAGTTASDTHTRADGMPPSPAPAAPPTPGVSLALVVALDEQEIAAAEWMLARKPRAPIREYALLLHREHAQNLAAARALTSAGRPVELEMTAQVHGLIGEGKATLEDVAKGPSAGHERAWLQAMVDDHVRALAMLDAQLLPAAKDEPLRNFLNNTRDHMAMHLERGRALLEAAGSH